MSTQIAIVGYHRSGTSAIAQNCQAAGLHVGEDLLGAKPTNPFGHYEDREFFEINEGILKLNFNRWDMITDFMPVLRPDCFKMATDLVSKRDAEFEVWGFKDPRTCVLLDFWHSVLPNPKYLVCLRHYSACIDSVLRRRLRDYLGVHDPRLAHRLGQGTVNYDAACANWCVYMSVVLKFLAFRKADALVLRVDKLSNDMSVAGALTERFDIALNPILLGETFEPALFQAKEQQDLPINPELRKTAESLWTQLLEFEDQIVPTKTQPAPVKMESAQ